MSLIRIRRTFNNVNSVLSQRTQVLYQPIYMRVSVGYVPIKEGGVRLNKV